MKIVKQSIEIWNQGKDLDDILKHIERCARVCYQTLAKDNTSGYDWIHKVIYKEGKPNIAQHYSVLEHGTIYLFTLKFEVANKYMTNPYSRCNMFERGYYYITTNMRVIVENKWDADLMYLCKPAEGHDLRITVSFITNIGVARELNRHRCHSISEESTRYCNYAKGRFGSEITIIQPPVDDSFNYNRLIEAAEAAEESYITLLKHGVPPQIARNVLPLCTKVQSIHTAYENDWINFLLLRAGEISGNVQPEMKELATMLQKQFKIDNYEEI